METVVECFVTDEIVLDKLAFNEWVAGRTAADAARQKEKELAKWLLNAQPPHRIANAFDPKWVMSRKINMQECAEQFQLYEWITPALNEPTQFHTQSLFVLQPADVAYMIETYYGYDEGVMRDLLGKSLTKAAIRDIQDQAEILGTKVNSTRRQFDNLKRILTRIEQHMLEKKSAGNKSAPASRSILSVIMQDFKLSIELAAQYQHIAFLCYNKIETSKSRLNVLDFTEWSALAGVVMAKWGTEDALDLDSSFTDMMRQAKETLMDRELANDLRKHVMALFRSSLHESPEPPSMAALGKEQLYYRHMLSGVESNFLNISRAVAQIGSGLQEWREIRDLFVDVNEKILAPLDASDLTLEQVVTLLGAMDKALATCAISTKSKAKLPPQWAGAWQKCVEGIKLLAVTMYPKIYGRHA